MSISSLLSQLVDIFRNWSHDTPEPYVLPAATADTLGGVKVGDGLSVTEDGTLSASGEEPIPRVVVNATMGSSMESMYAIANISKTPEEVKELFTSGKDFDVVFNVGSSDDVNSVFGSKTYTPNMPEYAISFMFGWTRVIVNGYAAIFETIVSCGYDEDTSSWGDWAISTKLTEIGSVH